MDIGILLVLLLVLDFVISIWNSYASGYNFKMLRKRGTDGSNFLLIYCILGLLIGIIGTVYVLAFAIGIGAYSMGYIDDSILTLLMAYNYLIFGGLITFLGIGVTVQTWVVAIRTHDKWAIVASIWNTFASILNLYNYIKDFKVITSIIKSESDDEKNTAWVIIMIAIAVIVAVLLSYLAFRAGGRKADLENKVVQG